MSCGGCSGAVERVLKKLDGKFYSAYHQAIAPLPRIVLDLRIYNILTQLQILDLIFWVLTFFPSGVKSFDVKLDSQTADVVAEQSLSYDTVLETIKKTGKAVNSGESDGQPMAVWVVDRFMGFLFLATYPGLSPFIHVFRRPSIMARQVVGLGWRW